MRSPMVQATSGPDARSLANAARIPVRRRLTDNSWHPELQQPFNACEQPSELPSTEERFVAPVDIAQVVGLDPSQFRFVLPAGATPNAVRDDKRRVLLARVVAILYVTPLPTGSHAVALLLVQLWSPGLGPLLAPPCRSTSRSTCMPSCTCSETRILGSQRS